MTDAVQGIDEKYVPFFSFLSWTEENVALMRWKININVPITSQKRNILLIKRRKYVMNNGSLIWKEPADVFLVST